MEYHYDFFIKMALKSIYFCIYTDFTKKTIKYINNELLERATIFHKNSLQHLRKRHKAKKHRRKNNSKSMHINNELVLEGRNI